MMFYRKKHSFTDSITTSNFRDASAELSFREKSADLPNLRLLNKVRITYLN